MNNTNDIYDKQNKQKPVGDILCDARIEKDKELKDIANILRIRLPFLEAIENSDYQRLPGTTYAIGFIRAYAEYLGLDSAKLINQFKIEADQLKHNTELHFPEPLVGTKIPGGAVIFICVILASVFYGAWIMISNNEQPISKIITQLPENLATMFNDDLIDSKNKVNIVEPLTTPEKIITAEEIKTELATETQEITTAEEIKTELATETQEISMPEENMAEIVVITEEIIQPEDINNGINIDETNEELAPTAPIVMAEINRKPRIYGKENINSRVIIIANSPTWVEISLPSGELILTRLLNNKDSFNVPNIDGLSLITGNAGGLDFMVDGVKIPNIGPIGSVRRNISLNVDDLVMVNENSQKITAP